MKNSEANNQQTSAQQDNKTSTLSPEPNQPPKLKRQRNGQYTGSLLG